MDQKVEILNAKKYEIIEKLKDPDSIAQYTFSHKRWTGEDAYEDLSNLKSRRMKAARILYYVITMAKNQPFVYYWFLESLRLKNVQLHSELSSKVNEEMNEQSSQQSPGHNLPQGEVVERNFLFWNKLAKQQIELLSEPPSEQDKERSQDILAELQHSQEEAVLEMQKWANENGGALILTDNGESHLHILPQLLQSNKWSADNLCEMVVDYDESFLPSSYKSYYDQNFGFSIGLKTILCNFFNVQSDAIFLDTSTTDGKLTAKVTMRNVTPDLEDKINSFCEVNRHLCRKLEKAKTDLMPVLKLSKSDFDADGDIRFPTEFGETQVRGGLPYNQPNRKWYRVGLKCTGKYENDNWLSMDDGSWAVGFHGCGSVDNTKSIAKSRTFFTDGSGQAYEDSEDINTFSINKGQPCGKGAYFANDIEISAGSYAATVGETRLVFQVRIHPEHLSIPKEVPEYMIVNDTKYIRPYGICIQSDWETSSESDDDYSYSSDSVECDCYSCTNE